MVGATLFGFVALILARVNIFGGFLVTQRMLAMYKKKELRRRDERQSRSLLYLVAGVLFILALRGLSHPETSPAGQSLRHDRHGASPIAHDAGWRISPAGFGRPGCLIVLGVAIGGGDRRRHRPARRR